MVSIALIVWLNPRPAEAQVSFTQITNTMGEVFTNTTPRSINADGSKIAFYSSHDLTGGNPDGNQEIFLWREGSGITQLTNTGGNNWYPSISADGTRIAFVSHNDLTPGSPGNADGNYEIFLATLSPSGDTDDDGVLDVSDNCPNEPNPDQADYDADHAGDVCDSDDDNDGVLDTGDNCPFNANQDQADADGDGRGDACDADPDGDTVVLHDNCPLAPNPD